MQLKRNLRFLRHKNGFSQEDIAKILGYKSYTTIQKWESGDSEPSVTVIQKLSELYGVTMDEIVNKDLEGSIDTNDLSEIKTIAAHANQSLTEKEIEKIEEYVRFLKSQRNDS